MKLSGAARSAYESGFTRALRTSAATDEGRRLDLWDAVAVALGEAEVADSHTVP
jgi:hypothetical protein